MIKFNSNQPDLIFIPKDAIEILVSAPVESIRLYMYGILNPCADKEKIMQDLEFSRADFAEAVDYLQKTGLIKIEMENGLQFSYAIFAENSKKEHLNQMYDDSEYNALIQSLFKNRILKYTDYKAVYECTDIFGLPREVVVTLIEYSIGKYGEKLPFKFITDEAKRWAKNNIQTIEKAKQYINMNAVAGEDLKDVIRQLGANVKINADYINMYERWTKEWGLSLSVIKKGITETNEKANSPSLAYLNKVLESYYKRNIKTPVDVDKYQQDYTENRRKAKEMLAKAGISKRVAACDVDLYFKLKNEYKLPHESILYAAEVARNYPAPLKTIQVIAKNWHNSGAHTLEEVKNQRVKFKPVDYDQRSYSDEEIRSQIYDTLAEMGDE